jgi:hypothetical protein
MSTIADRNMKETTTGAIMILSPDKSAATGRNYYVEWIVATHGDFGQLYGIMASVLTTQVA